MEIASLVKCILFTYFIRIRQSELIFLNYEFVSTFRPCILEWGLSDSHLPAGLFPASQHEILSKLTYSSIIIHTLQLLKSFIFNNRLHFLGSDKGWIIVDIGEMLVIKCYRT